MELRNLGSPILGIVILSTALLLQSCGSSNSSTGSNPLSYVGSASPGDVWSITLDRTAGTFSLKSDAGQPTVASAAYTYSGSLSVLSNGFLKLTVTTQSSGAPAVTIDGTQNVAYALEVPTVATIIQPASGGPVITAAYNGGCTALSGSGFNYVRTSFGGTTYNVNTSDAYGSITMNGNSSAPAVSGGSSFNITGGALTFSAPGTGSCSSGLITFPNNVTGLATAASGGIMILDTGKTNGGIVIFGGNSLGAADLASKTFNGLVFKNNTKGTTAIKVVFDSSSVGTASNYSSVANNTTGSAVAVIKSISGSGAISGTVYAGDGTSSASSFHGILQKVADTTGNYHIIMVGIAQDSGSSAPSNILLVQQ